MTTTPSDVVTKLGLQPRSFVVVKTFGVTAQLEVGASCSLGGASGRRRSRGSGRSRTRRRRSTRKIAGPTMSRVSPTRPSGIRPTMPGLERRVLEQHGDLGRVDERRHDRVDPDAVLRPFGRPLAGQRADRALGGHVRGVAGVDAEVRPDRRDVEDRPPVALRRSSARTAAWVGTIVLRTLSSMIQSQSDRAGIPRRDAAPCRRRRRRR